jgi:signal transduction histidine kinase
VGNCDKVSILLVDDQPARLLTYECILGDLGHNLVRATSGRDALDQLMRGEFAVVLLDVSMPDMDGFEVARLIHEHPRFERTPIIFVTGVHVSELDSIRGYKLGAVDYVSVPVVPDILRYKVSVLVELFNKRRQLKAANRSLEEANAEQARLNVTLQRMNAELERANISLQIEVRERARVELKLKERDRQKDEFLAMLAHELRNPLAPIHNAAQLMRRRPVGDAQPLWLLGIIERQLTHLTRLVDDLLDVSRITRGKIKLTRELVDVATLVARAVETVQPLIDERGHHLSVEMPAEKLSVLGDPVRLTQALANLFSNAAKYTERGGRITLTGAVRDGSIELRVRDTGIGIRADQLRIIFDLFTQLEGTSERTQSGLGIGLALVRQLVEMHGGTITAYSEGPGKGSEFLIRLPLYAREMAELAPAAEQPGQLPALTSPAEEFLSTGHEHPAARTVLVADDNRDALESLALLLELAGHRVYTAGNGQQSLESAERNRPEVALLDIGMPLLDGYEVARRIRAQPWGRDMRLVALTGWGQDSDRRLSRDAGFDCHLVKPVHMDELTEVLAGREPHSAKALEHS